MAKYVVAAVGEIQPGGRKLIEVADRPVGIFNLQGEFFALRNRCPHQGGPVCEGRLSGFVTASVPGEYRYSRPGEVLRCPWHGWEFDVRTGQSWYDPVRPRLRPYPVSVEPGTALVDVLEAPLADDPDAPVPGLQKGPYVAERYPVSVDERYVVVEIPD